MRKRLQQGNGAGHPTVRTVAARAGVSIASASRVLNGLGGSPETARRVRATAEEIGYTPNAIARSLQARRTDLVALAVEDIGNPVYVAMMRAVEAVLSESGRQLLVHATGGRVADETALLRRLAHRYVDGMIISPIRITDAHREALTGTPVPVVVIGQLADDIPVDNVRTDSRTGVRLAVDHLVAAGRRRIGFLNGPLDTVPGAARDAGFREALAAHGLPVDEALVEVGDFGYEPGRAAAQRLLARAVPRGFRSSSQASLPGLRPGSQGSLPGLGSSSQASLDAIVCANDVIAVGALHTLLDAGARVPQDVALVGMDDTELARMSFPQLSSVSLGSAERGRRAAELLLERIADPELPARREHVPPELVVRASSSRGTG